MLCTRENSVVFNSLDVIYCAFVKILMVTTHEKKHIWYLREKSKIYFLSYTFYRLHAVYHPLKKEVLKMQKKIFLANPNNFGSKKFVTFYEIALSHWMFSFTNKKVMSV